MCHEHKNEQQRPPSPAGHTLNDDAFYKPFLSRDEMPCYNLMLDIVLSDGIRLTYMQTKAFI